jgi:hypothetical protein
MEIDAVDQGLVKMRRRGEAAVLVQPDGEVDAESLYIRRSDKVM